MDSLIALLSPFVPLVVNIVLILLVFMFVVKPILNYFIVNREIENRKKLALEYSVAKREAESIRKENREASEGGNWTSRGVDSDKSDIAEQIPPINNADNGRA
nr:hypothetical protein [Desulfobulbaceae bacterium]